MLGLKAKHASGQGSHMIAMDFAGPMGNPLNTPISDPKKLPYTAPVLFRTAMSWFEFIHL